MRRLSYKKVKKYCEEVGYRLMSKYYRNCHENLEYICPNGHIYISTFNNFKRGTRCTRCIREADEEIKKILENEGYACLEPASQFNRQKIKVKCSNGHTQNLNWYSFKKGHRCLQCRVTSIGEIKKLVESYGYECLENSYIPSIDKTIKLKCPRGHIYKVKWYTFKQGSRCMKCERNSRKIKMEDVRIMADSCGFELLSSDYENARTKLKFCCKEYNHIVYKSWDLLKRGHGCEECYYISLIGPGSHSWRGGVSFQKYCEIWKDQEYKSYIRERDGNQCLNPQCNKKYLDYINIHHIDYNKKNCHPKNLITLCVSCNSLANSDREWHQAWYQAIMLKRYNHIYEF